MEIEWLQLFQFVNVCYGTRLDFQLGLPEVVVLRQILRIDSHLNNFSILLQLTEDIDIDPASIVHILEVLSLGVDFPISEEDPVFENILRWDLVVSFLDWPPISFGKCVMGQVDDSSGKLVCSSVFFFGLLLLCHGQVLHTSVSRRLQSVELLLLTHDILMTIASTLLSEDHLQWSFTLVFFFLNGPRHGC